MVFQTTDINDEMYSGRLNYNGTSYQFIFSDNHLRLIPESEELRSNMWTFGKKEISPGVYTWGNLPQIGEEILVGTCYENNRKIIFLPEPGSSLTHRNSVIYVELSAYILCKYSSDTVARICFSSPEINCIHPANKAIEYIIDLDNSPSKGTFEIHTVDFDQTTTEKQIFQVDGKTISVSFGISRTLSTNLWNAPISVWSNMIFEFEETTDYRFILMLCSLAKEFIAFLCYRQNIFFSKIELSTPQEDGKYQSFAELHIISENTTDTDIEILKKGQYIKQEYISGYEGKILSEINCNQLYLRNLPSSYSTGRHIDASRFIMITAAFEWEFNKLYPEGLAKSTKREEAEKIVTSKISELITDATGKTKEIYKFLLKCSAYSPSLANKIEKIGADFSEIIDPFGKQLYHLNGEEFDYSKMGKRIADQRNHFAHGDLDKDFIGLSLLDLIFLERIIYAMQLKSLGVENKNIQKSINELFHCNLSFD